MRLNEEDTKLISGDFLVSNLPSDKQWLLKYCEVEHIKVFTLYCLTFENLLKRVSMRGFCRLFIDHTGYIVRMSSLFEAYYRWKYLEQKLNEAIASKDFATISNIKTGKYKYNYKTLVKERKWKDSKPG